MAKPKTKESKVVSFSLDMKVLNKLDEYSSKTYIPKTKVVELALSKYIDDMENKRSSASSDEDKD